MRYACALVLLAGCLNPPFSRGVVVSIEPERDAAEARRHGCFTPDEELTAVDPPSGALIFESENLAGVLGQSFRLRIYRDDALEVEALDVELEDDDWIDIEAARLGALEQIHLTGRIFADERGLSMPHAILVSEQPSACFLLDVEPLPEAGTAADT